MWKISLKFYLLIFLISLNNTKKDVSAIMFGLRWKRCYTNSNFTFHLTSKNFWSLIFLCFCIFFLHFLSDRGGVFVFCRRAIVCIFLCEEYLAKNRDLHCFISVAICWNVKIKSVLCWFSVLITGAFERKHLSVLNVLCSNINECWNPNRNTNCW